MSATLDAKFTTYLSLLGSVQDPNGFIEFQTCDSLLFTGLLGCVQGVTIKIDSATSDGLWYRRPVDYPPVPIVALIAHSGGVSGTA